MERRQQLRPDERTYATASVLYAFFVNEFGAYPKKPLVAWGYVQRLRNSTAETLKEIGAEIHADKRLCEVGLAYLRTEFSAAKKRLQEQANG